MALSKYSEYVGSLSGASRSRYEGKVLSAGLKTDPYAISDSNWSNEPELIPKISWSDVMLYMVSTPSPYTKEAIKVRKSVMLRDSLNGRIYDFHFRLGKEW